MFPVKHSTAETVTTEAAEITEEKVIVPALWQINSRHADPRRAKSWPAWCIQAQAPLYVFAANFTAAVQHEHLGYIARGTTSLEYFWLGRGYNVFRFATSDGGLRNFYCNITLPPVLTIAPTKGIEIQTATATQTEQTPATAILSYQDLDLDLIIAPDGTWQILDEDEFAAHAELYQYPTAWREHAAQALRELLALVETRQFPFAELPC